MERYDHKKIEKKWQDRWKEADLYRTKEDPSKPKTFVLDMFPYPSGEGLHVGHPKGYIATDIYSRFKRMHGHSVLHPMGWDAFGLPAENYALKNKVHPRVAVEKNIATFKEQLSHIGFDYDWSREINTTDPAYYKWTQWIFLQLFKKGLAYQANEPINWCPSCMTGLANEDLDGALCERCGSTVKKRTMPQWVLKITAYADRMLKDLDTLDWPEHIKEAQRNWIGKSEGAEIEFQVAGTEEKIKVFTTRPDTLYGATYMVLAPEHPLIAHLKDKITNYTDISAYQAQTAGRTEIERTTDTKEKTGAELKGVKAINPATKKEIPIFIADYVLAHYGTGAIMAVPAHDERDFAFAKKFDIPIKQVIARQYYQTTEPGTYRPDESTLEKHGIITLIKHWSEEKYLALKWKEVDWGTFLTGGVDEGMTPEETVIKEIKEETGFLNPKIIRKLGVVDGIFYHVPKAKNQHVHGHIFEVRLENDAQEPVAPEEAAKHEILWLTPDELKSFLTPDTHQYSLRVLQEGYQPITEEGTLIDSEEFTGLSSEQGKKKIIESVGGKLTSTYKIRDWVFSRQRYWGEPIPIIHCEKCGAVAVPETDLPVLLPQVESYEPSGTGESPLASIDEWVNVKCPQCGGEGKRETNTMPQWAGSSWYYLRFMDPSNADAPVSTEREKYWAPVDVYVGGDHAVRHLIYARFWHKFLFDIGSVTTQEPFKRLEFLGFILAEDGRKMSKRYGNVINPTDVVNQFGADAFRVYEMFMGPFENTTSWSTASINGTARFIDRVWKIFHILVEKPVESLEVLLNQTVKKVTTDIEAFKFNTAVSQMMIVLNAIEKQGSFGTEQFKVFLKLLAPFAPHVTEELWEALEETGSIHLSPWPEVNMEKLLAKKAFIGVQVNGKLRGTVEVSPDMEEGDALSLARAEESVAKWLKEGKEVKAVYVPGRIISFVVEEGSS